MKKFLIITALVALVATPAMALSVVNSKHDMIATGFAVATGGAATEVCIFCHTPHGAQTSVGAFAPLWNQALGADVITNFYGEPGVDTVPGPPGSKIDFLTSVNLINATDAKLCLGCHDGTVGDPLNGSNLGEITTVGATSVMSSTANLGTMSNDHPTGMNLGPNPEANGTNIRSIATITTNFGADNPFYRPNPLDLTVNIMWCSSCHEVHDSDPAKAPFLRKSNVGSALCKACHNK